MPPTNADTIRSAVFARHLHVNSVNRRGGIMPDERIMVREIKSPLGGMIAGATQQGICFLEWCSGVEGAIKKIEKIFAIHILEGTHGFLDQLKAELEEYFGGKRKEFQVPVDIRGTDFKIAVWKQLQNIPYGETSSYGQLAMLLKKPSASRAVGTACGSNRVSIVIPCHRVLGADGGLHGYGGELWRKKYLLDLEQGLKPEITAEDSKPDQEVLPR
ncbi:MAG: methylated-DNA--[protein]-cysteine S-methyltransferase [candidate division Zixibacteria bacterium]|nr:methylated-DNA--[protein]-cysteine S-methyltransferase [candidate division Zixibacteria bacterium]